jgi:hypothetical protein
MPTFSHTRRPFSGCNDDELAVVIRSLSGMGDTPNALDAAMRESELRIVAKALPGIDEREERILFALALRKTREVRQASDKTGFEAKKASAIAKMAEDELRETYGLEIDWTDCSVEPVQELQG